MSDRRYRPFSYGTQFQDWLARNCDRCRRDSRESIETMCPIFRAFGDAFFGDGTVPEEAARRCGYLLPDGTERYMDLTWDCPERINR